jgi:hypothetical protein
MNFTHILLCCSNSSTTGKSRFGYAGSGSLDNYIFSCGATSQYYVSATGTGSDCTQISPCLTISTALGSSELLIGVIVSGVFLIILFFFFKLYLYAYNIAAHFQIVIR